MFQSHPGKALITHLTETADYAEQVVPYELRQVERIICGCHDFGKYTTYFQSYLETHVKKGELSNHSFLSALLVANILMNQTMEEEFLPLFAYNIVLNHHGNEGNLNSNLPVSYRTIDNEIGTLELRIEQAELQRVDMLKNVEQIVKEYAVFDLSKEVETFLQDGDFKEILQKLRKMYLNYQDFLEEETFDDELLENPKLISKYFLVQQLYSALIAADKLSASSTPVPDEKFIGFEELDSVRKSQISKGTKEAVPLNVYRTEIFEKVQEKIEQIFRTEQGELSSLYSITAPTGTGKTYCGFFSALKIRELLGGERRIIYALPFTSIINQNYDVIYQLLSQCSSSFEENTGHYLMKHHCLAHVDCRSQELDVSVTQAELLMENWSAPVIVTTFVQLLETLISNRNRMLKKLHSFRHSILIMDEVQAIPLELLPVCDYALRMAADLLDMKIITMTATKPVLLADSTELLENADWYFKQMHRTGIKYEEQEKTIEQFAETFVEQKEDKSYLIICNTIQSSLDLYRLLENMPFVYYLSTNLLPIHRKERIKEITEKLSAGEKLILVSTQAVEAGVDFDFDCVIRDIGPIDSIIQAAGRENRHQKKERGMVQVVVMTNAAGRLYGEMVYGKTQIQISKKLLSEKLEVSEEEYWNLISDYFQLATENSNRDISNEFIESLNFLRFTGKSDSKNTISDFSLIDEKSGYVNVFLRIDERAEETFQTYLSCMQSKNIEVRRKGLLDIRADVANYTLSIPERYLERINSVKADIAAGYMLSLPEEGCDEYYNRQTGFMREAEEEYLIF